MWTESNTPSKIEGAGGADVPKALIYSGLDLPFFVFMSFQAALRIHTSHVNKYKALQRGKKGEKA